MTARYTIPLIVVGSLFVVWGLFGLVDIRNTPYHGFINSSDYTIVEVEEGSPAAAAGLKVGDRIITFSGIPVEDSGVHADVPARDR